MGGIGAGLILAYILVISPALDNWDRLNKDLATGQSKLQAIQASLDEQVAAQKSLRELRDKTTVHNELRQLNQQTPGMLQQVESLPAYGSLTVRRLEGLPLREETEYYRSAVSLQFSGSLRNLHQFLSALEKSKPALKVDRLTISANRDRPELVEGQMVISGYAVVLANKGKRG
jgi:Tfp pilus assembly protein PilO